jgi:DNA replication and repair protein RecF
MEVRDLRNIREASLELSPGLNVFLGRNAQGKTSLLEALALLARGRSFRADQAHDAIRRGAERLTARGRALQPGRETRLQVEIAPAGRRFSVDGVPVAPQAYHGRLDVVVYSTDRLRVIRGPMRERRQFLDRGAAALWPAYRQTLRDYERIVEQRNAALASGRRDVAAWTERLVSVGASLRQRRGEYVRQLQAHMAGYRPDAEDYHVALDPTKEAARCGQQEERAGRSLVGPHRDGVQLRVNGLDASGCSSGQARSLLLALTLASLEVYRRARGSAAVALLDDLDSELDEERTLAVCEAPAGRGQVLVTTAPGLGQAPRRPRPTLRGSGRLCPGRAVIVPAKAGSGAISDPAPRRAPVARKRRSGGRPARNPNPRSK